MEKKIRTQLTLFVREIENFEIEKIRKTYNIEQYKLIKSHITLCRDDELNQLEKIKLNLEKLNFNSFFIYLGNPILFSNGRGVLIPIIGNHLEFQNLRRQILSGTNENPRNQEPHITLMHPGNSTCTNETFKIIQNTNFPAILKLDKINLIEQTNGDKWSILQEYKLNN
ncbi:2'-5' RNA ligase family protein [Mariniflexile sp.]|uniref:2'-5' RNA ligase family protein n=1 Tax=Mariniflexile sp. TaxID=1979402 RepID=UPI0040483CE8